MVEESKLEVISHKKETYIVSVGDDKILYIVNSKIGSKSSAPVNPSLSTGRSI